MLVPPAEARQLAQELLLDYVECSALTQQGVQNVFETAIHSMLSNCSQTKKKSGFGSRLFGFVSRSSKSSQTNLEPEPPIMPPAGLYHSLFIVQLVAEYAW